MASGSKSAERTMPSTLSSPLVADDELRVAVRGEELAQFFGRLASTSIHSMSGRGVMIADTR